MRSYIFQIDPHHEQAIHGIIGPACSAAAIPVAELARSFNLILVSVVSGIYVNVVLKIHYSLSDI